MHWQVDSTPDANGHWTVRPADGSAHGDTAAQPIATVYEHATALLIADQHNQPQPAGLPLESVTSQMYIDKLTEQATTNGKLQATVVQLQQQLVELSKYSRWYNEERAVTSKLEAKNKALRLQIRELKAKTTPSAAE